MTMKKKTYSNAVLGISFDYVSDWIYVDDCKRTQGVDVCMYKDFANFGLIAVAEKLNKDIVTLANEEDTAAAAAVLEIVLRSSVLMNETIIEDVRINKHDIKNADSATIMLNRLDSHEGNMTHERTLVMRQDNGQCFIIAYEDIPENFESGYAQQQLRELYDSFRFL